MKRGHSCVAEPATVQPWVSWTPSSGRPLATILNAENNWWGDASGPAPYGSGNGVNEFVDADPWLAAPAFAAGRGR
ncbi:MAG: hypothetical protein HY690_19490 [Chloroflexi bacterium]|nr:hypothetical protein [Chloroflexota bacterium]